MTGPFRYPDYSGYGHVSTEEWNSYLNTHRMLVDSLFKELQGLGIAGSGMQGPGPGQQGAPTAYNGAGNFIEDPNAPPKSRPAALDELLGQAMYWGIPNAEAMDPASLYQEIQARRAGVQRPPEATLGSQAAAGVGMFAAASGSLARVAGNLAGLVQDLPFAGHTLSKILGSEQAKQWLYDVSRGTESYVEWARATQPPSDKTATDIALATGKVAGYALPAFLAWEGMGAMGGMGPIAGWTARVGSPFARAALKGAFTSAALELGSDETANAKALSVGMGAAMGFATAIPKIGASIGLGLMGAGIGGQVGDTPEERGRNAAIFGVASALIPMVPAFLGASVKARTDIPGPHDTNVREAITLRPMGEQGPRRPVTAQGRIVGQQALPSGPDYEVMGPEALPQGPEDMAKLLVRSEPQTPEQVLAQGQGPVPPSRQLTGPLTPGGQQAYDITLENLRRYEGAARGDLGATQIPFADIPTPESINENLTSLNTDLYTINRFDRRTQGPGPVPQALLGTKVVDATGHPLVVYHGTGTDFEAFDMNKADSGALYGPGFYHTEDPQIASGYAGVIPDVSSYSEQLATNEQMMSRADPSQLPALQQQRQLIQQMLAEHMANVPTVKPARLNIQNPFDVDAPLDRTKAVQILDLADRVYGPEGKQWWAIMRRAVQGEGVHDMLDQMSDFDGGYLGPNKLETNGDFYNAMVSVGLDEPDEQAKEAMRFLLEETGHDGITHIGGAITGSPPHRVWIAFDPSQVQSPWDVPELNTQDAVASAQAISKQSTIIESGVLPAEVGKTQLTDADVIASAKIANPGGVSIIKGIDPTKWSEGTLRDFLSSARGRDVTFVEKNGKLDALVGVVTPEHVAQYRAYGRFQGQKVTTTTGLEGEILNPNTSKGLVSIRVGDGPPRAFRPEKILPSRFSAPMTSVPDLWGSFKADVLNYVSGEVAKAGMPPVEGLYDPRVAGLLHERMYDFFDRMGINEPAVRQGLDEDFTRRYAIEARDLDPQMRDLQARIMDQAIAMHNQVESSTRPIPTSLEEAAQSKGFVWIANPGDGGAFHDTINPGTPPIPVETDQGATEFLANVDRALPDFTPAADIPVEVMEHVPTEAGIEPRLEPERQEDSLQRTLDHFNSPGDPGYIPLGTGGAPPGLPPGSGGPPPGAIGPGFYSMGPVPPPPPSLGGQFEAMQGSDPVRYARLVESFKNSIMMRLHYTRYGMLRMESNLTDEGITLGRAWDKWQALDTARIKAGNEAFGWLNEYGKIMKLYPRRILRDGTAARIHEIEDPNARYAAIYRLAETHGYTQNKINRIIKADGQVTDFMHRFGTYLSNDPNYNMSLDRMIFRYLPHVRARQAQDSPDPYNINYLPSEIQFFGEHIREGNVQTRIMDLRELGNYMVRAAMHKKYEAEPWADLVNTWQDKRIPEPIRNYVLDAARLIRYGYDARGELAVHGLRSVMGKFGIPISSAEAQHLLGIPQGAMYMSLLAGRMSIFFRDAIQPLMTLTRVDPTVLGGVYGDVLRGGKDAVAAIYSRGLAGGWIEKENPNIENVGMFEEPAEINQDLAGLTDPQKARREAIARVIDNAAELPDWLTRPSRSPLSTLRWYAKLGQTNRMIAGEAGYRWAKQHIDAYRQSTIEAAIAGDPSQVIDYKMMADKANFTTMEKPIQRKLQELIGAGDDEGAAQLFARELASATQFKYGRRQMPPLLRGTVGRMLFSFSNFTGQFGEFLATHIQNRSENPLQGARQGVKALLALGGISAALYTLKAETGWGFDKWVWGQAFQYTGGPLMELAVRGAAAYMGAVGRLSGGRPVPSYQTEAIKASEPSFGAAAADYFPYTGYFRSFGEYAAAAQGMNPFEQAARYTITGDRGSRIDLQRELERAGNFQQGQLSPNGGQMPGQPGNPPPPAPPAQGYGFPAGPRLPKPNPGGGFQQ